METVTTPTTPRDETFTKSLPHTPPYTPYSAWPRFQAADSPASVHSTHPFETSSPVGSEEQTTPSQDGVKIEELHEGDAGFTNHGQHIYPQELEEPKSPARSHTSLSTSSSSTSSVDSDEEESEITEYLARLACAETPSEQRRRLKRQRKRADSRVFKRTHSQSVQSDVEMSDADGMPDQDRGASARRLRRRLRGPSEVVVDEVDRTPPPSRGYGGAAPPTFGIIHRVRSETPSAWDTNDDAMDVDDNSE